MFEEQTYEAILARTLARVATDVDKREGSVVMNAIAPVSAEHANIYILLDALAQNGYADTAIRTYLIKRCKERGITPYEATKAVLKGKFNMSISLDSRFSLGELNYKAIAFIEGANGFYYYQMECETAGTEGNKYFGELSPIEFIHKDLEGELVELLIPAGDEEETEALRERYMESFKTTPYGGNKADYIEKTDALDGVGGTVVIPVWAGGGTVKLIIIDREFNVGTDTLVEFVQNEIDPTPQGTGTGIAPIGHKVTVVTPQEYPVNVVCDFTFAYGYTWEGVAESVENTIKDYLLELRKTWESEEGNLVVRLSQIETRLLGLEGILDVTDTTLNGSDDNLTLTAEQLPVFGGVVNG